LTVFRPENLTINQIAPQIHITGIGVNNHELSPGDSTGILPLSTDVTAKISLKWNQNLLSIRFAALDFTAPVQNQYRYRLVGVDRDWVEAGTKNVANYSHLESGTYEFEVIGSNCDGVWSPVPARLTVVVYPPWWLSWWAYLAYAVLIAWAAWTYYQIKVRRIRLENLLVFEKREANRLAEIDELKNRFFSNVTHEFRTPLTLIIEPLRQVLPELRDPKVAEKVRLAEKNSRQLLHLVNQLLELSKLESGKLELDLRKGDFYETTLAVFQSFLPLAEAKNIRMKFEYDRSLPVFAFDRNRVELIVNNLLSNALKFTNEGGVIRVSLQAGQNDQMVQLKVTDTGIGIPVQSIHQVFDRFYQVDNSSTRKVEGTGIGLALTKELVEWMGGTITVESTGRAGEGSAFTVQLPMSEAESLPFNRVQPPVQPENKNISAPSEDGVSIRANHRNQDGQPLVLIVEDNPDLRKFIKQSLPSSYQIIEAGNGAAGIRQALEFVPDLIISDVMMPEKDGYQVCDELKNNEITSHIPIILLTAKTALDSKLTGLRTGADDYLTKPFNTEELVARIENLIETRRVLREKYSKGSRENREALTGFSRIDQDFLQKVTLLLDSQLDNENFTIEDFARQLLISRVQLHRKLKALTTQSATDFIRDYRLERAMELLKQKQGNVTQVAGMVGFGNEKYFSTVFKEKFGVSPSQV
jgi:signal transduction histidine kinase/DNA-binding response OmpR family regulator